MAICDAPSEVKSKKHFIIRKAARKSGLFFWDIIFNISFPNQMTLKEKANYVIDKLEELYPTVPIPLDHTDEYTLLVSVLLSAQCTDKRVNLITPALFARANNPADMAKVPVDEIREIIKPCGLSPRKSRAISELSQILLDKHNGIVPQSFEYLEELPGVGHKTASVVMSQAFGVPAFPVDTHIHRLMYRWGLTNGKNVEQTEKDAKKLFPEELWNKLHLQIIFYGREYSPARNPKLDVDFITREIGRKSVLKDYK
jgi:endonuclease-3